MNLSNPNTAMGPAAVASFGNRGARPSAAKRRNNALHPGLQPFQVPCQGLGLDDADPRQLNNWTVTRSQKVSIASTPSRWIKAKAKLPLGPTGTTG